MIRKVPHFVAMLLFLSGCAVHPLTEEVTRLDTNAVVFHIRCEARDAITVAIGRYLTGQQGDDYSLRLGSELVDRRKQFADVDLGKVNVVARRNIAKYIPAGIAYDFTFDITEINTAGAQIDFFDTFTNGTFGLGLGAQSDRQRQTVRNFRISDTFGELIGPTSYCVPKAPQNDLIYPISGSIGLAELVTTFVDLNEFQSLGPPKDAKDKAPVLADTFAFQTLLSGSASPKVTLSPVGRNLQFTGASLSVGGSRKDIHKVIIAVSLPPLERFPVASRVVPFAGTLLQPTTTTFRKTPAEQNAIAEIYNQIGRNILTNVVVRPF